MKECPGCGKTYDDSWGMCLQCDEPLIETGIDDSEKDKIRARVRKKRDIKEYTIKGNKLTCSVCGNTFFIRSGAVLMKPSVFGIKWSDLYGGGNCSTDGSTVTNYICDICGHIIWFRY